MDQGHGSKEKLTRILRMAAAIFAQKGFHRASIRDISAATGISLSGLYYYFRSKEELLFLIQDRCIGRVLELAREAVARESDPQIRLRLLVRTHLRFFVANMAEMKVLSHEAGSPGGELRSRIREKKREYVRLLEGILREMEPRVDPGDVRVSAMGLFGMMNWIYQWYHPEGEVGVDRLAETLSLIFLEGYRSPRLPGSLAAVAETGSDGVPSLWHTPRAAGNPGEEGNS